eukprot:TRINITY_DN2746_c2_g1_i1.p1 TRINITY_DN2746_c2_g1~~TRINITY_DN2746_c2_g1_i1.p1  ORF type:complete len:597 (+),score=198.95 TRINITY_DN2746_c2_g1_i1:1310-3100(+)
MISATTYAELLERLPLDADDDSADEAEFVPRTSTHRQSPPPNSESATAGDGCGIGRRTRAHVSLADFELDELEATLNQFSAPASPVDDDPDFVPEYTEFLARLFSADAADSEADLGGLHSDDDDADWLHGAISSPVPPAGEARTASQPGQPATHDDDDDEAQHAGDGDDERDSEEYRADRGVQISRDELRQLQHDAADTACWLDAPPSSVVSGPVCPPRRRSQRATAGVVGRTTLASQPTSSSSNQQQPPAAAAYRVLRPHYVPPAPSPAAALQHGLPHSADLPFETGGATPSAHAAATAAEPSSSSPPSSSSAASSSSSASCSVGQQYGQAAAASAAAAAVLSTEQLSRLGQQAASLWQLLVQQFVAARHALLPAAAERAWRLLLDAYVMWGWPGAPCGLLRVPAATERLLSELHQLCSQTAPDSNQSRLQALAILSSSDGFDAHLSPADPHTLALSALRRHFTPAEVALVHRGVECCGRDWIIIAERYLPAKPPDKIRKFYTNARRSLQVDQHHQQQPTAADNRLEAPMPATVASRKRRRGSAAEAAHAPQTPWQFGSSSSSNKRKRVGRVAGWLCCRQRSTQPPTHTHPQQFP